MLEVLTPSCCDVEWRMVGDLLVGCLFDLLMRILFDLTAERWKGRPMSALLSSRSGRGGVLRMVGSDRELIKW